MMINGLLKKITNLKGYYVFGAIVCLFFLLNILTPISLDDYAGMYIWDGEHGGNLDFMYGDRFRMETGQDWLESLKSYYFTWGGRLISGALVSFFLMYDKIWFDICNTVVFAGLIYMIYSLGTGSYSFTAMKKKYLLWIFFCLWACNLAFGNACLWLSGSISYSWTLLLQLLFVAIYIEFYQNKIKNTRFDSSLVRWEICGLGLVAGCSTEMPGLIVGGMLMLICWRLRQEKRLNIALLQAFVCYCLGYALLIFSPGNYARYTAINNNPVYYDATLVQPLTFKIMIVVFAISFMGPMILQITPMLRTEIRKILFLKKRIDVYFVALFMIATLLDFMILPLTPRISNRLFLFSCVWLCIASLRAMSLYQEIRYQIWHNNIKKVFYVVATFFCVITIHWTIQSGNAILQQENDRIAYLQNHLGEDVEVPSYRIKNNSWGAVRQLFIVTHLQIAELSEYKDFWYNRFYAKTYGVQSVQIEK